MVIEAPLEDTQVLVEDAERDDGGARPEEDGVRGDAPASEDDAGVDDVSVPANIEREYEQQATIYGQILPHQSMFILHIGIMGMSCPPCPPWSIVLK